MHELDGDPAHPNYWHMFASTWAWRPGVLDPVVRLAVATCAVIGGAESWEAIAEYGRTKAAFFRRFLPLANGIPSADTFERVFAKLEPGAFARAFGRWMAAACHPVRAAVRPVRRVRLPGLCPGRPQQTVMKPAPVLVLLMVGVVAAVACREVNAPLAAAAKRAGKDCELVAVPGGHQAMVAPAVQQAVRWFRQLEGR